MATELSLEQTEARAKELLDGRIQSIRDLVTSRQQLTDLQAQVENAERKDVQLYAAAQRNGWSPDELRKLGIGEPAKRARVRKRSAAKTSTPDAPAANS